MRILYVLSAFVLVSVNAYGGESVEEKIARAQSAAHPAISENATIMVPIRVDE